MAIPSSPTPKYSPSTESSTNNSFRPVPKAGQTSSKPISYAQALISRPNSAPPHSYANVLSGKSLSSANFPSSSHLSSSSSAGSNVPSNPVTSSASPAAPTASPASCESPSAPASFAHYTCPGDLWQEIGPKWSEFANLASPSTTLEAPMDEVARGFEAYRNANSTNMPCLLLGDIDLRFEKGLIRNLGTLATTPPPGSIRDVADHLRRSRCLSGKALNTEIEKHVKSGAIIKDSRWWIVRNDLFVLGAIHAGKEFHIYYTDKMRGKCKNGIPPQYLLWHRKNNRPRALGREILMVAAAGYKPTLHNNELCFIPPVVNNAYTYTQMSDIVKRESVSMDTMNKYLATIEPFPWSPSPSQVNSDSSASSSSPSPTPLDADSNGRSLSLQKPPENWSDDLIAGSSPSDSPVSFVDPSGKENKGPSLLGPDDE